MFIFGDGGGRRLFYEGSFSVVVFLWCCYFVFGFYFIWYFGIGVFYSCLFVEFFVLFVLRFRSVDNGWFFVLMVWDLENVNFNLVFVGLELVVVIVCSYGGVCEWDKWCVVYGGEWWIGCFSFSFGFCVIVEILI